MMEPVFEYSEKRIIDDDFLVLCTVYHAYAPVGNGNFMVRRERRVASGDGNEISDLSFNFSKDGYAPYINETWFSTADHYRDGYAIVSTDKNGRYYGIMDISGNIIGSSEFHNVSYFDDIDGRARVENMDGCGYMDKSGNLLWGKMYESIERICKVEGETYYAAKCGKKWTLLSDKRQDICSGMEDVPDFRDNLFRIKKSTNYLFMKTDGGYTWYNTLLRVVDMFVSFPFDDVYAVESRNMHFTSVSDSNCYMLSKNNGVMSLGEHCQKVAEFEEGICICKVGKSLKNTRRSSINPTQIDYKYMAVSIFEGKPIGLLCDVSTGWGFDELSIDRGGHINVTFKL